MRKIWLVALSLFFLTVNLSHAADQGKIAIAAEGKTANSKVSSVAARSPYFLVFDGVGKLTEVVDNPYKDAKRGAGISIVTFLAQKGVNLVVAGEFGDKMIQAMKTKGIKYLEFKGSAEDALKKVLEKK